MATVTLRPNGAGAETTLAPFPAIANWDCVDEDPANDDTDNVLNSASGVYQRDLYAIPTSGIPAGSTINSVTIFWRAEKVQIASRAGSGKPSLRTNAATSDGTGVTLTTSWITRSQAWTMNPVTGVAWTLAEINALQIGEALIFADIDYGYSTCTQVYVVIDYTAPKHRFGDGFIWVSR